MKALVVCNDFRFTLNWHHDAKLALLTYVEFNINHVSLDDQWNINIFFFILKFKEKNGSERNGNCIELGGGRKKESKIEF